MAPVVWAELRPPRPGPGDDSKRHSLRLGEWLNKGNRLFGAAAGILGFAVFAVLPVAFVVDAFVSAPAAEASALLRPLSMADRGGLLAGPASLLVLLAMTGRLRYLDAGTISVVVFLLKLSPDELAELLRKEPVDQGRLPCPIWCRD